MEDEDEQEEEAKGSMQKSRGLHLAAGKKCFSMLFLGNTVASFQDVPRKDFRHMDAAKKNPTPRKVRERNGEREDRLEHKSSGFWQRLILIKRGKRWTE